MRATGLFGNAYDGTRVFLTGNTGFKGSWLQLWLESLGALVVGYSLDPPSHPSHFPLLGLEGPTVRGDIRDLEAMRRAMSEAAPDIVFHMAAQPLVRKSYQEPVTTFETNVLGTVNVFEACRATGSVRAIVNITSDKCYENREQIWGYRECDPMGGHDPYSASKGCAELVTAAWRRSFFAQAHAPILLASVRAGNVIGGGDWGEDRLVPDIARATCQGAETLIRTPLAVRPWQHVLEPLAGYLQLGRRLLAGDAEAATGWNFGPDDSAFLPVRDLAETFSLHWPDARFRFAECADGPHEAHLLKLDSTRAREVLRWRPVWNTSEGIARTAAWYRAHHEQGQVLTRGQLDDYVRQARSLSLPWTS